VNVDSHNKTFGINAAVAFIGLGSGVVNYAGRTHCMNLWLNNAISAQLNSAWASSYQPESEAIFAEMVPTPGHTQKNADRCVGRHIKKQRRVAEA
jgi:hypothetical protein